MFCVISSTQKRQVWRSTATLQAALNGRLPRQMADLTVAIECRPGVRGRVSCKEGATAPAWKNRGVPVAAVMLFVLRDRMQPGQVLQQDAAALQIEDTIL